MTSDQIGISAYEPTLKNFVERQILLAGGALTTVVPGAPESFPINESCLWRTGHCCSEADLLIESAFHNEVVLLSEIVAFEVQIVGFDLSEIRYYDCLDLCPVCQSFLFVIALIKIGCWSSWTGTRICDAFAITPGVHVEYALKAVGWRWWAWHHVWLSAAEWDKNSRKEAKY